MYTLISQLSALSYVKLHVDFEKKHAGVRQPRARVEKYEKPNFSKDSITRSHVSLCREALAMISFDFAYRKTPGAKISLDFDNWCASGAQTSKKMLSKFKATKNRYSEEK